MVEFVKLDIVNLNKSCAKSRNNHSYFFALAFASGGKFLVPSPTGGWMIKK
ncbi:MAG TPA: hypothetical protein VJB67_02830 [Patescibacteria group bacterium]|nr:hypothetical protein [Patescibacteria group bacterium]